MIADPLNKPIGNYVFQSRVSSLGLCRIICLHLLFGPFFINLYAINYIIRVIDAIAMLIYMHTVVKISLG